MRADAAAMGQLTECGINLLGMPLLFLAARSGRQPRTAWSETRRIQKPAPPVEQQKFHSRGRAPIEPRAATRHSALPGSNAPAGWRTPVRDGISILSLGRYARQLRLFK